MSHAALITSVRQQTFRGSGDSVTDAISNPSPNYHGMSANATLFDTKFKQQRLDGWRPAPMTPTQVGLVSVAIGVVAAAIAAVVFVANAGVVQYDLPYPTDCVPGGNCSLQFKPDRDLTGPVFFYYKIEGMYQNHRRYVKSKSSDQLRGLNDTRTGSCQPLERDDGGRILYPCGLIAASHFRDRIQLEIDGQLQQGPNWSNESIATEHDRLYFQENDRYQFSTQFTNQNRTIQLPTVTDPDFMVWMHTAPLPTFANLHRVRRDSIRAGAQLRFLIDDHYDVAPFDGRKSLVLRTLSFLGGNQTFMAWAWAGLALSCFLFGIVMCAAGVKLQTRPRPIHGDEIA